MDYQTEITKSIVNGWQAESVVKIGVDENGHDRGIEFSTCKGNRGQITTRATVFVYPDANSKQTIIFQDYSATVATVSGRATEKSIAAAHENASAMFADHVAAAKEQYYNQAA